MSNSNKVEFMVFSSILFLFYFMPVALLSYFVIRKDFRNLLLLLISLFFYFAGEGKYIIIMLLFIIINYSFGLLIEDFSNSSKNKTKILYIGVFCFNIGFLIFFKYFNFIIDNINLIIKFTGYSFNAPKIHLPIGISFFTFQSLSYIIDVYRKDIKAQRSLIKYSMYISFFPQLIAGPIVRYIDISNQVDNRYVNFEKISQGVIRFIIGLGKKVIIANTLASTADKIFKLTGNDLSVFIAWLGIICYALQLYFDFSGYSDMAIGLGKMFGFDFLENFNYPYISKSVQEFWKRWHISLSSWFRDYLYIPLGGNRKGKIRTYINLLIVFVLCGLWHGAGWTFIFWGLWHGTFLIFERTKFGTFISKQHVSIKYMYTSLVVLIGWVFFRSESFSYSLYFLKAMFFNFNFDFNSIIYYLNFKVLLVLILGVLGCTPVFKNILYHLDNYKSKTFFKLLKVELFLKSLFIIFLFLVFFYSIILLSNDTYNPFIYFRF